MFSIYNGIKVEISFKKRKHKTLNTWKSNNAFLHNLWAKEKDSTETLKYLEPK
jgi:hypothetical protein